MELRQGVDLSCVLWKMNSCRKLAFEKMYGRRRLGDGIFEKSE